MFLKHKKLILIFLIALGLLVTLPAYASWPATPLLPPCATGSQTEPVGAPVNAKCGFNDFILLGVNLSKIESRPTKKVLGEYYSLRGWDKNGVPTEAKLTELGIDVRL